MIKKHSLVSALPYVDNASIPVGDYFETRHLSISVPNTSKLKSPRTRV